jgi:hypothetical protein
MHARMEAAWIHGAGGFWHAICMASPVICNGGDDAWPEAAKTPTPTSRSVSEQEAGRSKEDAERIAWATVNKQDGGGRKATKDKRDDSKRTS